MTGTWNGVKKHGRVLGNQETRTAGGYSGSQVTHEHFIVVIPDGMDVQKTAPILCAGITLWDPLRHYGLTDPSKPKKVIGIAGIGGLGTMGIKLAAALGHKVVAISTSDKKQQLATEKGATGFVVSKDPKSLEENAGTIDYILNTVAANHDINTYMPLLATNGVMIGIGGVTQPHTVHQMGLMFKRKTITGSLIGGIASTQEVVNFCNEKQIYPDIKMITAAGLNDAWKDLAENNNADGIRYVIDIKASLKDAAFLPPQ